MVGVQRRQSHPKSVTPSVPWGGKSVYVWLLDGTPSAIPPAAKRLGVSSVLVKSSDGPRWLGQLERCTSPFHDAGLTLGAWAYCYPTNITEQSDLIHRALSMADYLVIDAEVEFETAANGSHLASLLMEAVSDVKGKIGFTSFSIPSLHPHFPWQAFASGVSFAMPQCYWSEQGVTPQRSYTKGIDGYKGFGLPIVPVGECQGKATPSEIQEFVSLSAANPGVSFWEWYEASQSQLAAIG